MTRWRIDRGGARACVLATVCWAHGAGSWAQGDVPPPSGGDDHRLEIRYESPHDLSDRPEPLQAFAHESLREPAGRARHRQVRHVDEAAHGQGRRQYRSGKESMPVRGHRHGDHGKHAHTTHADQGVPGVQDADGGRDTALRTAPLAQAEQTGFPEFGPMTQHMHDDAVHYFVLADRLETQRSDGSSLLVWDVKGWMGRDFNRLWIRSEGARKGGATVEGEVEALWGRPVGRWWDMLAGVRHDFAPGLSQTWLALGVIGLAPYRFDVEATAYLGEQGRTALQVEAEYDALLTNRLILQPRIELLAHGKAIPERRVGSGFSRIAIGARLRYEIRREFAPYIGVEWERSVGDTADLHEAAGERPEDTRAVVGVRVWF